MAKQRPDKLQEAYARLRELNSPMSNKKGRLNPEWDLPIIPDCEHKETTNGKD